MSAAHGPAGSPPAARVGVVGSTSLVRRLRAAARDLDIELHSVGDRGAIAIPPRGPGRLVGGPTDGPLDALTTCDVISVERAHPAIDPLLTHLRRVGRTLRPEPGIVALAADRVASREVLARADLPVAAFAVVPAGRGMAVEAFAGQHGWPVVLKSPTRVPDGHRVDLIWRPSDLAASGVAQGSHRWLLEELLPVAAELVVVVARRPSGWWRTYPVAEVVHREGTWREVVAPARITPRQAGDAARLAVTIANGIDAVGILTVEVFLTAGGHLVVNGFDLGPQESGDALASVHATSQAENHLRGLLDWPLGDTDLAGGAAASVQLLDPGHAIDVDRTLPEVLADPGTRVHLADAAVGAGRGLGHVTTLAPDPERALDAAHRSAAALLSPIPA